jgi:hypothetical protein
MYYVPRFVYMHACVTIWQMSCSPPRALAVADDDDAWHGRAAAEREELPAAVGELPPAGPQAGQDHPRRGDRHPPPARHARQQVRTHTRTRTRTIRRRRTQ